MSEVLIRELNTTDENDLKMYEEALYKAFFYDRRVLEDAARIYDHKNNRSITKVPYDHQYILVAQLGSKIIATVCANFDTTNMQVELRGFNIEKNSRTCEILHIFNNSGSVGTSVMIKLGDTVLEKLKHDDMKKIYSTCTERRRRQYESMGFKIEKMNELNNDKRYLMLMDL